MGDVARQLDTWVSLQAEGAELSVAVAGLTAPQVQVRAPRAVTPRLRAALAWRTDAMRAQIQERRRLGLEAHQVPTPVAVPGAARRWRSGLCRSCLDPVDRYASGDCNLCNAARVAALRTEQQLPPAEVLVLPPRPPEEAPYARHAQPDPLPPPTRPAPWNCDHCGRLVEGLPRDPRGECGPCEMKRIQVVDTSRLGGSR